MFAAPDLPPAEYVISAGMNEWANCDLGYAALRRSLNSFQDGELTTLPEFGPGPFRQYSHGFVLTEPGNPLHPALLLRGIKSGSSRTREWIVGGCGFGDPIRFTATLRGYGWSAEDVSIRQVTGRPWREGDQAKFHVMPDADPVVFLNRRPSLVAPKTFD